MYTTPVTLIRSVQLDTRNEPIVPLAEKVLVRGKTLSGDDHGINVNPPYQREPVWGAERQRNLIRSLLMGLPIGALIFNERAYPEWRVCIDGKQRLLTVRNWVKDDLVVPAEWFEMVGVHPLYDRTVQTAAGPYVSWKCLTETGRRVFDNAATASTYTARLRAPTKKGLIEREEELFDLINYGGVPQGERD